MAEDNEPTIPSIAHTEPVDEAAPLARLVVERVEQYKAFILWMMADPDKRSMGIVARSLGRPVSTVAQWSKRFRWSARASKAGPGGQSAALGIYRSEWAARTSAMEFEAIKPRITIPLHPQDQIPAAELPKPEAVIEQEMKAAQAEAARREALPPPPPGPAAKKNAAEIALLKRGIQLTDGLLASFAQDLVHDTKTDPKTGLPVNPKKKIRIGAKDLPNLIQRRIWLQRDLEKAESGVDPQVRGLVEIPESYRVKAARASGGGIAVLEAVRDDLQDLQITFNALLAQTGADREREAYLEGLGPTGPVEVEENREAAG